MNPPYNSKAWTDALPKWQENLIAAAGSADARLVVLENLYMVGTGDGGPINEDTPTNPRSRKGEIRARLAEALFSAHRRGDANVVSGRASDFYGPRGFGTHFGERFWRPALRGKPAEFVPNPDTPHTYHFIPDVAEGLRLLGCAPEHVLGRPWMLPCAPAEPSRALVERFTQVLGREIELKGMPTAVVKILGIVMPIVREVGEMLHQWEVPFVVNDSRFREEFSMTATDPDKGAAATVHWAKAQFGMAY
jgi:nucleoside-diphosphate-sugar epimerase